MLEGVIVVFSLINYNDVVGYYYYVMFDDMCKVLDEVEVGFEVWFKCDVSECVEIFNWIVDVFECYMVEFIVICMCEVGKVV